MTRLAVAFALAAALVAILVASASGRLHRLHRPAPPLPASLAVDEREWSVSPSQTVVAAGNVQFEVYDRGEDAHNLVVQNAAGVVEGTASLLPGGSARIVANLEPGTYLLYCSMFYGTPQSHYARGMHTLLTVR